MASTLRRRRLRSARGVEVVSILLLLLSWSAAFPAHGEAAVPSLAALRIDVPIVVDGLLDDDAWHRAEVTEDFVQKDPDPGARPSERTEVRVAFTERTLFVAVRAFDSHMSDLSARHLGRDISLLGDDSVSFLVDTFLDHRNGYVFGTNALGVKNDSLVTDERGSGSRWDGIWRVATRRDEEGWSAEFAVPLSILRFDPRQDVWGFQVRRVLSRRNEISFWAPLRREETFLRVSRAGRLTGLSGLRPPRDVRLKSFVTADSLRTTEGAAVERRDGLDAGLDLKWGLGRNLTLDLTVNTDFAETEADDQQVNLTRFSLFLPEKRDFFQEHAGIFAFGPNLGSQFRLFFSRRIGIDAGRPVPIDFGARLAGRHGPWSVGLLGVATDSLDEVPANRWGVVRLKRNVGERSHIGVLAGTRRGSDGSRNRVSGIDASFKPSRRLELWGFAAATSGSPESEGEAFGAGALYRADTWRWAVRSLWIEDTFDPQIGFVQRAGSGVHRLEAGWGPRTDWKGVRNLDYTLRGTVYTTEDDELETVDAALDLFAVRLESGARLALITQYRFEDLVDPFEIFDGVVLARGTYRWQDFGVVFRSSDDAALSFRGFIIGGDFFNGRRLTHRLTLDWRPSARWSWRSQWNRNDIELPTGSFETNVWRQRIRFAWSRDLEASLFLQYNDAAELSALHLRSAWRFRPGSELFVVYDEIWDSPTLAERRERDRRLALKLSYTFGL